MVTREPRDRREEVARRGQDVYDRSVRPTLRPEDDGKFVAIDVESGDFELDADDYTATERLLGRRPDAQMWLMQVGQRAAYRLGFRSATRTAG